MKELSIEQKAKCYDEALEKARQLCAYPTTKPFISDLQDLFPELAESEEERIRKHLIGVVELYYGNTDEQEKKDCLAWLERQGEKGTKRNNGEIPFSEQKQDVNIQINPSEYINDMGGNGCYLKNTTQASAWTEEDNINCTRLLYFLDGGNLMQDHKIELFVWLKSLKERVQPQPKQEWSDEDEINIEKVIWYVENPAPMVVKDSMLVEWLKSLRPKSQWKPSDEQMNNK